MTPFGSYIRHLRDEHKTTLRQMSKAIGVSPAYISGLEHGWKGTVSDDLLKKIYHFFNLTLQEKEHLESLLKISNPKVTLDTGGLSPRATERANVLKKNITLLDDETIEWVLQEIQGPQLRGNNQYILPPSVFKDHRPKED